jgi:hypothetical protein
MPILDIVVLGFGFLVSALVCAGFLLLFYGHAHLEQARRENTHLNTGMKRLAKLMGEEPA